MKSKIPKSEIEIETKMDVPLTDHPEKVIESIEKILNLEGWRVLHERDDQKDLTYYDSPNLDLHKQGATLRMVSPFDEKRFPGIVRYDFKQGKGPLRLEAKGFAKEILGCEEIISCLGLEKRLTQISPIVQVHINPIFLDIQKGRLEAELKLDTCSYQERPLFRELEIELKKGDPSDLYKLSDKISKGLGFNYLHQQKYSRVIDHLNLNGGKS